MLVFQRKKGESFWIGDDVEIIILDNKGAVKVGIKAPVEIPVHRDEVLQRIKSEKRVANAVK